MPRAAIYDCATGDLTVRDLTAEEGAELTRLQQAADEERVIREQAEAALAAAEARRQADLHAMLAEWRAKRAPIER